MKALSETRAWRPFILASTTLALFFWLLQTPPGLLGKADAIGYAVCHRIDNRSFHLGERAIPLCARCTGQYLGALLGMVYLALRRPRRVGRPPWHVILVLAGLALAFVVDGVNSFLHLIPGLSRFYLYQPHNLLRLVTGTGLGLGISVMLFPAFNLTVWKRWDRRPVLEGFRDFGLLLALATLVILLVWTENPLLLYPLALLSAAGVLLLLTMVYTMVLLIAFKAENHFLESRDTIVPVMAGFLLGLSQIAFLDLLRFLLTRTWEGFRFG